MKQIILLCGKPCSGKTTYANRLKKEENAVVLSCDELMLSLFGDDLGDNHRIVLEKVKAYLYRKAIDIAETGTTVILDFGFWSKEERRNVTAYFTVMKMPVEWHYLNISDDMWNKRIAIRNKEVQAGVSKSYFIDDGFKKKIADNFEEPNELRGFMVEINQE